MVSGYFIAQKASKLYCNEKVIDEVIGYTKKRYLSLIPYTFVATIMSLCCNFFFNDWSIKQLVINSVLSIPDIFLLQMEGIPLFAASGVSWYLSVLIMTIIVFYPILLKKQTNPFAFGLLSLLIYGFLITNYGSLENPGKWLGFCYVGTLRGFAGVSAGITLYIVTQKSIWENNCNPLFIIIFTILSNFLIIGCICRMIFLRESSYLDIYIVFGMYISLIGIFSEKNYVSVWLNKYNMTIFAKASFAIYLGHYYVVTNIINCPITKIQSIVFNVVLIICVSIIIHFCGRYIYKMLIRIFSKD